MAEFEAYQKQILIEQRITNEGKSIGAAYILWFILGAFGAHRFYLGATRSAIVMLILTLTIVGYLITFIWWIVDIFLIPSMVRNYNEKLRIRLNQQYSRIH